MSGSTALERAFELARSGKCGSVAEIRSRLKAEGLDMEQLHGKALINQLRELMTACRAEERRGNDLNASDDK